MPVSLAEVPIFEKTRSMTGNQPALADKGVAFDSFQSQQIQAAMQRKFKYGFNPLSAPQACLDSLTETGIIIPERKAYTRENNFTTICEGITSGGYIWSGERGWDKERGGYSAFAKWYFLDILQAGIDDLRAKIVQSGSMEHAFELDRRGAEWKLENWFNLTTLRQEKAPQLREVTSKPPTYQPRMITISPESDDLDSNFLRDRVILTGSAFPSLLRKAEDQSNSGNMKEEEEDQVPEEVSSSLGYRFKERLGKLRFEIFRNNTRQTIELSVEQGSIGPFKKLLTAMGVEGAEGIMDSTQLLGTPIDLGDSANYMDTITRWATTFDEVLEGENAGLLYFCGRPVTKPEEKDYQSLMDKQRWLRKEGKGLVEALSRMDFELAKSFFRGSPTEKILTDAAYWLSTRDKTGDPVLTPDEQAALAQVAKDQPLSHEAAFVLKKNELIRILTIGACIINPQKAEEFFTQQQIYYIKDTIESQPTAVLNQDFIRHVDQMIALAKVTFVLCGGSLEKAKAKSTFGTSILIALGIVAVSNDLMDPEEKYYKSGTCRSCGESTDVGRCQVCRQCAKHMSDNTMLIPLISHVSQITN